MPYSRHREPEPPVPVRFAFVVGVLIAAAVLVASVTAATVLAQFHVEQALDANANPAVRR